jgi:hypothetical protein
MTNGNQLTREEQAWLTEYQVCEQDNASNFQGYWTLAAIFFGISSALLAGLIYGVLSNKSLFYILFYNDEPKKTFIVGTIAIVLALANIIILFKIKGWHRRIMYNQNNNSRRMREIELQLGSMNREWRTYTIKKWTDRFGNKPSNECDEQIWQKLRSILVGELEDDLINKINSLQKPLVREIKNYFKDWKNKIYEHPSSRKHFPCILHTITFLWVIIISASIFLMITTYYYWMLGLTSGALIIVEIFYIICDIKKTNKIEEHKS